jgi:hypothetical protein
MLFLIIGLAAGVAVQYYLNVAKYVGLKTPKTT